MEGRILFTLLLVLFALLNYALADGRIKWDRSDCYAGSELDRQMRRTSRFVGHLFLAMAALQAAILINGLR